MNQTIYSLLCFDINDLVYPIAEFETREEAEKAGALAVSLDEEFIRFEVDAYEWKYEN